MALKLQKTYKGFNAEYWKITKLVLDDSTNRVMLSLSLYKNMTSRQENINNYIKTITKIIGYDDINLNGNIKQECYNYIKRSVIVDEVETNEFASASDVLE